MTAAAISIAHPVIAAVRGEGFEALGWFSPEPADRVPGDPQFAILVGNAGPAMFERFARERDPARDRLDDWCRMVIGDLAQRLGAAAHFPFDLPPLPFSVWGRRARAGHASPLGLNVHPDFGLWHAYRALLAFPRPLDLPERPDTPSPCDTCPDRPCLTNCPVHAFSGEGYDVTACAGHLRTQAGHDCMELGCRARRACPVGRDFLYAPSQARFHMSAFLGARSAVTR